MMDKSNLFERIKKEGKSHPLWQHSIRYNIMTPVVDNGAGIDHHDGGDRH